MSVSPAKFLFPPKLPDYEKTQKARLLHVMLIAIFIGGSLIAYQNYEQGWTREATILFLLAVASLIGIYFNHTSRLELAAFILSTSMLITNHLALFHGAGLFDSGILGYPIFMLCTAFLFGKSGLVIATLFSISSIILLYVSEINGLSTSPYPATTNRIFVMSLLFLVMASVGWVVRETWERHLFSVRESYDLTLQGWAKALEYRDGETAGHTRRVVALCLDLARKLGIDEHELLQMQRGAYLHDIGKMAIPDKILLKPGPLDDEERIVMKQHPELAVNMLSEIPFLQPALAIPHFHHEYWDGTGYPEGRKGEEIPLSARIFTIVDHWDALSSDRPYRKAWTKERIIAYMGENTGKIYDPRIADVFLSIVQ